MGEISSSKLAPSLKETVAVKSTIDILNKEVISQISSPTSCLSKATAKDTKGSQKSKIKKAEDIEGLFFFDQTAMGIHLVEVIHQKRSEQLGKADSKIVYYKKSKCFIIEDQQLFKVTMKELKKSRFGVDLSRIELEKLKNFMAIVLLSNMNSFRQAVHYWRRARRIPSERSLRN